jgi:aminoglycoside 6'-N-acetyltransferase I
VPDSMIVSITSENIKECVLAFIEAYNGTPWNYNWTYEKANQYLSEYMSCGQFVGFAIYDEGQLAGAVLGHTKTWWTNRQLMIDEFFVSSEKQGKGHGKKLLDHCDKYAAENDLTTVVLMTNKYMPAYNFYNKIGYTATEQYVFMFKQVV